MPSASTAWLRTGWRGSGLARTFQECRVLADETCMDNVLFAAQDKRLGREMHAGRHRGTGRPAQL